LGAVRNQKIIPWTADVDVVIPKEEFGKLDKVLKPTFTLCSSIVAFLEEETA
jgi:phosphorylcholine metabolism protein LicD